MFAHPPAQLRTFAMFKLPRNVYLISAVMAMNFTVVSMMVLVTGLLGAAIAPRENMATLPVAVIIIGTACTTIPAALWMQKFGRKVGMATGILVAIIGTLVSYVAAQTSQFWLLVLGMFLIGSNAAFTQQGRFIIIENTHSEKQQADGLTLALLANLFAAILGPFLGAWGRDLIASPAGFAGSFMLAAVVLLLGLMILSRFQNSDRPLPSHDVAGRSLVAIARQPIFIIAAGSAAVGYAVMSLIMTATPISMHHMDGHTLDDTRLVIQSHIVAMFLPSLLTGYLVKRGWRLKLIVIALLVYLFVVVVGFAGIELMHYWWALVLLGLGWNFLFLTSTTLLPRAYRDTERFKVQALNDFIVFSVQAAAAFSAGWLLFNQGWQNLLSVALGITLLWLALLLPLTRSIRPLQ